MTTLHKLKKQYILGEITKAEYKKKEEKYILLLLDMHYNGMLTKEELYKRVTG